VPNLLQNGVDKGSPAETYTGRLADAIAIVIAVSSDSEELASGPWFVILYCSEGFAFTSIAAMVATVAADIKLCAIVAVLVSGHKGLLKS
jgi:hypothetical protein